MSSKGYTHNRATLKIKGEGVTIDTILQPVTKKVKKEGLDQIPQP